MTDGGRLTTHVLDTSLGCPAADLTITLYRMDGATPLHLASVVTNGDGRCDVPLLEGEAMQPGIYELIFDVGAYFAAKGIAGGFLSIVPIRFSITDSKSHYHVPLLLSPFGYSTYRGS